MQFEIEFEAGHLLRIMEAARREITLPADIMRSVGDTLVRRNQERHDKGLAPDGTKWQELSPRTLAQGKRRGGPLNKTGDMLQSFHRQLHGNTLVLGFDGARDAKLAGFHHFGTKPKPPKHARVLAFANIVAQRVGHPGLPKRELIGFPDSDREAAENVTASHLQQILARAR